MILTEVQPNIRGRLPAGLKGNDENRKYIRNSERVKYKNTVRILEKIFYIEKNTEI